MELNRFRQATGLYVGYSSVHSIYHRMFELVKNFRLYAYADDSLQLTVLRKPADRPADAASRSRCLARIHEESNH